MRTEAHGARFAIASPYHLSSFFGLRRYIDIARPADSAIATFFSLHLNLPHMCGLGGDALIIFKRGFDQPVAVVNGTGRTGSGQSADRYRATGLDAVPRRGALSAMIGGATAALREFEKALDIDMSAIVDALRPDLEKPLPISGQSSRLIGSHKQELTGPHGMPAAWQAALGLQAGDRHHPAQHSDLFQRILREGFQSFYSGSIAEITLSALNRQHAELFVESDFVQFSPPKAQMANLEVFGTKLSLHAANSPWIELCLSLCVIEHLVDELGAFNAPAMRLWARLPASIDRIVRAHNLDDVRYAEPHSVLRDRLPGAVTDVLADLLSDQAPLEPARERVENTVFFGCASTTGEVIGITSSIFTPFGSLIDPGDLGCLISNRAHSFSLSRGLTQLLPRQPARHTTNVILVETGDAVFCLGTSGGAAQVQVLSQLLFRVLCLGQSAQAALEAPRIVNLGRHPATGMPSVLVESRAGRASVEGELVKMGVTLEPSLSLKMGVAQIAGVLKCNNTVFAATDPRGDGAALAI
jgi:gamma-glutamyltranspeptidase